MSLSTHVLDTSRGVPVADVSVRLDIDDDAAWIEAAAGRTDADGRLSDWVPAAAWRAGTYRLVFDTTAYLGADAFFPEVTIAFTVTDPTVHLHVPLLLSPFGYTTYRGS